MVLACEGAQPAGSPLSTKHRHGYWSDAVGCWQRHLAVAQVTCARLWIM